jgi:hypothetical protein
VAGASAYLVKSRAVLDLADTVVAVARASGQAFDKVAAPPTSKQVQNSRERERAEGKEHQPMIRERSRHELLSPFPAPPTTSRR